MQDNTERRTEIRALHEEVDIEAVEADLSRDPSGVPDTQLDAYVARLRGLHDSIVAVEEYEDSAGEAPPTR